MLPDSLQNWLDMLANGVLGLSRELVAHPQVTQTTGSTQITPPFSVVELDDWVESVRLWNEHGRPLIAELEHRACPACGEDRHHRIFETFDGYPYHACEECGTWFIPLDVDYQIFNRYFERCAAARALERTIVHARLTPERGALDRDRFRGNLDGLMPFLDAEGGPDRSILDVGCGMGFSLEVAAELGLRSAGIEVEPQSVESCRSRDLAVGPDKAHLGDETFGVLTMWETIEHLDTPMEILDGVLDRMAPGGILAMTFPNLHCPTVRVLRSECSWIYGGTYTPGHVNMFGPRGIARLLERLGLSVLTVDGQYGLNQRELIGFLTGSYGGVSDLLHGRRHAVDSSPLLNQIEMTLSPALTKLEQSFTASPILRVVACRSSDHNALAPIAARINASNLSAFTNDANAMLPPAGSPVGERPSFGGRTFEPLATARTIRSTVDSVIRTVRRSDSGSPAQSPTT